MCWYHDAPCIKDLARDNQFAPATAYRYFHEGIDVLAVRAPDLHQVIADAAEAAGELRDWAPGLFYRHRGTQREVITNPPSGRILIAISVVPEPRVTSSES